MDDTRSSWGRSRVVAIAAAAAALGLTHCAASSSDSGLFVESRGTAEPATDAATDAASPPFPTSDGGVADVGTGGSTPPTPPPQTRIVLVNATAEFPAFRMCPAAPGSTLADPFTLPGALAKPVPTAFMPRSNLAGADLGGAAYIEPGSEFNGAKSVILLKIDETTKRNPALAEGSCAVLACTKTSGGCVGPGKAVLVELTAPFTGGEIGKPGNVILLVDDATAPSKLRLEAVNPGKPPRPPSFDPSRLHVQLVNRPSASVSYRTAPGADAGIPVAPGAVTALPRGVAVTASFFVDGAGSTLAQIQDDSVPRADPANYWASTGTYALLALGASGDAGGRPKLLAFPLAELPAPAGE